MHSFALDVMTRQNRHSGVKSKGCGPVLYRTVSTAPTVNDGIKDYKLVHTVAAAEPSR
jgi:hypothetical protein